MFFCTLDLKSHSQLLPNQLKVVAGSCYMVCDEKRKRFLRKVETVYFSSGTTIYRWLQKASYHISNAYLRVLICNLIAIFGFTMANRKLRN